MKMSRTEGGRRYGDTLVPGAFHAVTTDPTFRDKIDAPLYQAENVVNGWTRLAQNPASMWRSDPGQALPQWVELDFGRKIDFNTVHLTFVTDPNGHKPGLSFSSTCVRNYELSALVDGEWVRVIKEEGNFQRHRVHSFATRAAAKLRLTVFATHGDTSASVFEIRVYNEEL